MNAIKCAIINNETFIVVNLSFVKSIDSSFGVLSYDQLKSFISYP
jgi:hypothetical protein